MSHGKREKNIRRRTFVVDDSSNSSKALDVADINDEETAEVLYLKIEYNSTGSNEEKVELYDDTAGTAQGDLSGRLDKFHLEAGDRVVPEDISYEEIENDLVANFVDGAFDAEITITVTLGIITG